MSDTYAAPLRLQTYACYRHRMLRGRYARAVWFYYTTHSYLSWVAAQQGITDDVADRIIHDLLLSILVKRLRRSEVMPFLRGGLKCAIANCDSYT